MTKQEAVEAMKLGKKVKHRFFDSDEWITMVNDMIVTEEGYSFSSNEFWMLRQTVQWENDWSIVFE